MRRRSLIRMLAAVASLALVVGCSAFDRVSRADAVEACEGAYRLLDEVPNPLAGQPRSMWGVEPQTMRASDQEIDARYVAVRVAAVRSGDRDLEQALSSLEGAMWLYILIPTALVGASSEEILSTVGEFGRLQSVFLDVCREKKYL